MGSLSDGDGKSDACIIQKTSHTNRGTLYKQMAVPNSGSNTTSSTS